MEDTWHQHNVYTDVNSIEIQTHGNGVAHPSAGVGRARGEAVGGSKLHSLFGPRDFRSERANSKVRSFTKPSPQSHICHSKRNGKQNKRRRTNTQTHTARKTEAGKPREHMLFCTNLRRACINRGPQPNHNSNLSFSLI